MRSFAASDRFVADMKSRKLAPGYVFIGDEAFFRRKCREAILQHLVPEDVRELSLYDMDLAEVDLREVLDRARTPSLMAPFQVFFIRGVKNLYGRGKHDEEFAAIKEYFANPNPDAMLVFIADHISIPADVRRMDMTDKERYERIRETLGEYCQVLELARVEEGDAVNWADRVGRRRRREARSGCGARAGGLSGRRHDDDRQRAGEAGCCSWARRSVSGWAMWRRWCSRPSSGHSTS